MSTPSPAHRSCQASPSHSPSPLQSVSASTTDRGAVAQTSSAPDKAPSAQAAKEQPQHNNDGGGHGVDARPQPGQRTRTTSPAAQGAGNKATEAAVATTQAASGNGQPRLTVERRSLSVNTGSLSHSPAPPLSPSAVQTQSIDRPLLASGLPSATAAASARDPTPSARAGQALATMHEEYQNGVSASASDHLGLMSAPLLADASFAFAADPRQASSRWAQHQEGQFRSSRHRSTSSAAALALHGSGSNFDDGDSFPSLSTMRIGPSVPARSIWERDATPGGVGGGGEGFGAIGAYRAGSSPQTFQSAVQRGFSFSSSFHNGAASLERPGGSDSLRDRGVSFGSSGVPTQYRGSFYPSASQSGAPGDRSRNGASHYSPASFGQATFYTDSTEAQAAAGIESRRHSIAGDLTLDAGSAFGGQRRAVGFEVGRSTGFMAPSRNAADEAISGRTRSSSFAPFGSGSLALTDDDLAGDPDFVPLQKELERAKQEQDREHQQRGDDEGGFRVPSSTAAAAGAHATSMPSIFGGRRFSGYSSSPVTSGLDFGRPAQGRLAQNGGGGMDSLSASWDILTPSAQVGGRSPDDRRDSIALVAEQLRRTSIGGERGDPRDRTSDDPSQLDDDHAAGTATVKGSPGASPRQAQMRTSSRFSLSPTAMVFQRGQLGGPAALGGDGTAGLSTYNETYLRQRSASSASDRSAFAAPAFPQQAAFGGSGGGGVYPSDSLSGGRAYAPVSGSGFNPSASSTVAAGGAFVNPYMVPSPSLPAPPQLSDFAFGGLASLGPLPPPSGGGPGGFGPGGQQQTELQELGKGLPLASLAKDTPLYIVEFKQGRTDLFFCHRGSDDLSSRHIGDETIVKGDLVIVEADRGKDLGSVVNDSITVEQVQSFLAHQSELAMLAGGGGRSAGSEDASSSSGGGGLGSSPTSPIAARPTRSINPKRLFAKATSADTSLLYSKAQDEERALQLCITKVSQRGLPMTIVAAEMQWDRRKLTFYYTASMRVDFRDLVKELFRLYKTRIWMCHLGHPSGSGMV